MIAAGVSSSERPRSATGDTGVLLKRGPTHLGFLGRSGPWSGLRLCHVNAALARPYAHTGDRPFPPRHWNGTVRPLRARMILLDQVFLVFGPATPGASARASEFTNWENKK